jgi:hypothetical protein
VRRAAKRKTLYVIVGEIAGRARGGMEVNADRFSPI